MDTRTSRGEARHRFRHAGRSVILLLTATAGCSQLGSWRDASGHAGGGRVSPPARTQRPGSTSSGWHVRPRFADIKEYRPMCGGPVRVALYAVAFRRGRLQRTAAGRRAVLGLQDRPPGPRLRVRSGALRRRQSPTRGRAALPRHDVELWPPSPDPRGGPGGRFDPFGSRDRRRPS